MTRNRNMKLVEDADLPDEEVELNPDLGKFIKDLVDDHISDLPVEVASALSKEDLEEWAVSVQHSVEDGITSIVENTIGIIESDFVEVDDEDADDINEEDDADQ